MTREEAKELYPIIEGFSLGKDIQVRQTGCSEWTDFKDGDKIDMDNYEYRIKPCYRPFNSRTECWNEMLKHQPIGWLEYNCNEGNKTLIHTLSELGIHTDKTFSDNFKYALELYRFVDGEPFGIKET